MEVLDLSDNLIDDASSLGPLLKIRSLKQLYLSSNKFGAESESSFFSALAASRSLEFLAVDLNPLSIGFAKALLAALKQNSTVIRIGILIVGVPVKMISQIRHAVAMNDAGRQWWQENPERSELMARVLARSSTELSILYGLLRTKPAILLR